MINMIYNIVYYILLHDYMLYDTVCDIVVIHDVILQIACKARFSTHLNPLTI